MQKGRDQLETMLGSRQDRKSSAQHASYDDILRHDELKKVVDEGNVSLKACLADLSPGPPG